MMGLFGGVGLAFLFERLDSSIKNNEDVGKATGGVATLGVVPAFAQDGFMKRYAHGNGHFKVKIETKNGIAAGRKKKRKKEKEKEKERRRRGALLDLGGSGSAARLREKEKLSDAREPRPAEKNAVEPEIKSIELITYLSPKSDLAESYRTIRTSLLLSSADKKPKAIVVTSALPEEGKSATLSNLAVTLAQAGKNVLILDTDFRKPTQHKIFKYRNSVGLTNYLTSEKEIKEFVKGTGIPNLYLINAGPVPPNPAELLGSEKMGELIETMKQWFDYILLDSPPVLTVSDALVLGPKADGMILVVWGGKTAREALKRAKQKLDVMNIRCLGVVINNISVQDSDYYYVHQYYHHYREGERQHKA
jgi:capsular exopolysaccharide synthesis family protein